MGKIKGSASIKSNEINQHLSLGLTDEEVLSIYSKMILARTLDQRVWLLNRQGKVPIVASSQGHEAAQMGSLLAAQKHGDYFVFPYYRDLSLKVMAGVTTLEAMLSYMGKDGDPFSGARQFPLQGAYLKGKMIQISNVVCSGIVHAVGYALACKQLKEDTVVLSYFGDGATSQGEWHEALNFAGVHRLPVVFFCENNKYAISVPLSKQMAIKNVADRACGYGFPGVVIDGMNVFQVYKNTLNAIDHARNEGPILLEMNVERFLPHTTDDDDRRYREPGELESALKRDPVLHLRNYLTDLGLMNEQQDTDIRSEARREIDESTESAEAASFPHPTTFYDHVYM